MTAEQLAALAGILLSLLFAYAPGVRQWFDALEGTQKRLVMGAALLVAATGVLAYQCRGDGACYTANVETFVWALVAALVANQSAYSLAVRPKPAPDVSERLAHFVGSDAGDVS